MKIKIHKSICSLALLAGGVALSSAGNVNYLSTNPTCSPDAPFALSGDWFTVGADSITLSDLGFYDQGGDGLSSSHQVGVLNAGGTLLASVTVASSTTDTLNNGYRWASLNTPLTLDATTLYLLVATTGSDGTYYGSASQAGLGTGLTYSGESYGFSVGGSLAIPDYNYVNVGASGMWNNPNMAYTINASVPEPSTLALVGLGGLGLLHYRRRQ